MVPCILVTNCAMYSCDQLISAYVYLPYIYMYFSHGYVFGHISVNLVSDNISNIFKDYYPVWKKVASPEIEPTSYSKLVNILRDSRLLDWIN